MGSFSIGHWIIVLAVVLLLFGAGKVPKAMGDLARGFKTFRAGLKDDADDEKPEAERLPDDRANKRANDRA